MNSRRGIRTLVFACALILLVVIAAPACNKSEEEERAITWEEVPQAAQTTIMKQAGEMEITELEEVTIDGEVFYEAEWMENDMEVEVLIAADGKLIEREMESPDEEDDEEDDEESKDD